MNQKPSPRCTLSHFLVSAVLFSLLLAHARAASKRVFYLGIDSVLWDYYPRYAFNRSLNSGDRADLCTGKSFLPDQLLFVGNGSSWGSFTPTSVYQKLRFQPYTDRTFTSLVNRTAEEEHLGILGPILRVEARDVIIVYVRGVLGNTSDAASYGFQIDGLKALSGRKEVRPGKISKFVFHVPASALSTGYVSSRLLLYRGVKDSLINGGVDGGAATYEGLIGPLILYQPSSLDLFNKPLGIFTELVTVLTVSNENSGGESEEEEESNLMHGINGRIYCSLDGLDVTLGRTTRWYFASVGNEVDVHVAHMHGLVGITNSGLHSDSIRLLPGSTAAMDIIPDVVGSWLFHCHINDHLHAGMTALVNVRSDGSSKPPSPTPVARERHYYIRAESVLWDYAPKGWNVCDSTNYGPDENIFVRPGIPVYSDTGTALGYTIGSQYLKSRYVEYTDDTFTTRKERGENFEHLGLMGPVLRARVGESIVIHFQNNGSHPTSMHPHGVLYEKDSEGALYNDGTPNQMKMDDSVPPGASHTYRWEVPDRAGPGPGEHKDVKMWIYHGHCSEIVDTYAGLFGVIVVVGRLASYNNQTLLPMDGSREVFIHMSVMNEAQSNYIFENVKRTTGNQNLNDEQVEALIENEDFSESNLMHSINGYLYCNGPVVKIPRHERTRFHFYALGTEVTGIATVDVHTPTVGGEILKFDFKASSGSGALLPGFFSSAAVRPQNQGVSEIRCNVNDHYTAGMRSLVFVEGNHDGQIETGASIRQHYIAAVEIDWDYTPLGRDGCTGSGFDDDQKVFTEPGLYRPGSKYIKTVYKEYEDGTFSTLKFADTNITGIVGPLLHFEAGERVKIVFKNMGSFHCNLNLVGFELIGDTLDTTGIAPGEETTYLFRAPKYISTSANDLSSVAYVYYSSVNPISHTAAGLVGVAAVTKPGMLDQNRMMPIGVGKTVPWLMNIFNENDSPHLIQSVKRFATNNNAIDSEVLQKYMEDEEWMEGNTMHSVNGYLYSSLREKIEFGFRETVRFYLFGFGSESSMHGPAWYGQTIKGRSLLGASDSGVQIFPFNAQTVDVAMSSRGWWPFVCEVSDHVLGGMKMCFEVD